jgi:hypothetical protein
MTPQNAKRPGFYRTGQPHDSAEDGRLPALKVNPGSRDAVNQSAESQGRKCGIDEIVGG